MKPGTMVTTILLALVAVLHLGRLYYHVEVTVNGAVLPMWVSIFGFLFTGSLALLLWYENRR